MRLALLLLGAMLLIGAAPVPEPEAPPPVLARHLKDGAPDPDDIVWMRGGFTGASAAEKADWEAIQDWLGRCFDAGTAKVRSDLEALGVTLAPSTEKFPAPLCVAFASLSPPPDLQGDWDRYLALNRQAKAVFDSFFYGAKLGFESAPFDRAWVSDEALQLLHAIVREQVYRKALSWEVGGPAIDSAVRQVLMRRIGMLVTIEDGKNTAMLMTLVAEHGWPSIPQVGERASDAAWLLVQHADMDPAFQLQALRLMEPLVASGGVSKPNYAYLYDRVMLKVAGAQRYGTQMTCRAGQRVRRPLEPGVHVDAKRAEVGLGPVADYIATMNTSFGACPPDKPG